MRLGSVEYIMPRCGTIDRFDVAVGASVAVAVLVLPKFDGACWGGRSFSNMLGSKKMKFISSSPSMTKFRFMI